MTTTEVTAGSVGFVSGDGTKMEGTISFQPGAETIGVGTIVVPVKVTMVVSGGQIVAPNELIGSEELPVTYIVTEYWAGIDPVKYQIICSGATVDLSTDRAAIG